MTLFLFVLTVVIGSIGPLGIKYVLSTGYPYPLLTFWRSAVCIAIVLLLATRSQIRLDRLLSGVSLKRALIGGIILCLSIYSYSFLSATEVNVLSRMDLPLFLLFFGAGSKRAGAATIIVLGVLYSALPIFRGHGAGIFSVWLACCLTAFSYSLIREAATMQSFAALVMPPYFGSIVVSIGLLRGIPTLPPAGIMPAILLTSGSTVALYFLTAVLFKRTRLGVSELTGSLALIGTFVAENVFLGQSPPLVSGIAAVVGAVLGTILVYWEEVPKWLKTKV